MRNGKGQYIPYLFKLSKKRKRPDNILPAAKRLIAAEGIDEGKIAKQAYYELFNVDMKLV